MKLQKNDRVEFLTDFDVYPHATISEGARGIIINVNKIIIKLDVEVDGLEDWDNEVYLGDYIENQLDLLPKIIKII